VQCRSSISWCVQLHQGFPWRQNVLGSNEAYRHREQQALRSSAEARVMEYRRTGIRHQ
jgi:hypothetical protein